MGDAASGFVQGLASTLGPTLSEIDARSEERGYRTAMLGLERDKLSEAKRVADLSHEMERSRVAREERESEERIRGEREERPFRLKESEARASQAFADAVKKQFEVEEDKEGRQVRDAERTVALRRLMETARRLPDVMRAEADKAMADAKLAGLSAGQAEIALKYLPREKEADARAKRLHERLIRSQIASAATARTRDEVGLQKDRQEVEAAALDTFLKLNPELTASSVDQELRNVILQTYAQANAANVSPEVFAESTNAVLRALGAVESGILNRDEAFAHSQAIAEAIRDSVENPNDDGAKANLIKAKSAFREAVEAKRPIVAEKSRAAAARAEWPKAVIGSKAVPIPPLPGGGGAKEVEFDRLAAERERWVQSLYETAVQDPSSGVKPGALTSDKILELKRYYVTRQDAPFSFRRMIRRFQSDVGLMPSLEEYIKQNQAESRK